MRIDETLECICEYADICSSSNYGNKDDCYDKADCGMYKKMVVAEIRLWEYSQTFGGDDDVEDDKTVA